MAGVNKAMLLGNLGRDPELRWTQSGQAVCNFSLATSESWTDQQGERVEKVEWHRIVVWGKPAEACAQYLYKGSSCFIEGRLTTRAWESREGEQRQTTEIVAQSVQFLGKKGDGQRSDNRDGMDQSRGDDNYDQSQADDGDSDRQQPPLDDDIPF